MDCCLRACLDQWATSKDHKSSDPLEISFVLKNYDTNMHPLIYENLTLKHDPKIKVNVCILGDDQLCREAKDHGFLFIGPRDLVSMKRKTDLSFETVRRYDLFLASPNVMKMIPQKLDAALKRTGKRPFVVMPGEPLLDKISEARVVVCFRVKDTPFLSFPIGNMGMTLQKLPDNLEVAMDPVLSLLPLKWDNVMCIHIAPKNGTWVPVYS